MKKLYTMMILLVAFAFAASSQVLFNEDFSSGVPPTGWSIDAHSGNWSQVSTANAGGTAPEARLYWSPQFVGETYLISPVTNTTGYTALGFSFRHGLDHYGGAYTLGVATRSAAGAWNTVWELVNPSASIPGEEISFLIFNADVGAADFEIAIFFSGDSYNINYWYIDDAKLFVPQEHDVATKAVLGGQYFNMGDNYEASAKIANAGLSIEAFDVVVEIYDIPTHDLLFTDTQTIDKLEPGLDTQVDFGGFTLPTANGLFEVKVFTALTGDMDPTNDTNRLYVNTYTSERNLVLLEIGTGTWCVYCPGAAMGADDLIANGKNVAVMEHHSGDDYENEYSAARVSLYGIGGFPTGVFDGVISSVGGNANTSIYPTYLPLYEQRAAVKTAFNVELFGGSTGGNDYEVLATVDKLAAAMNPNVVLHIGLTESEIPEVWFVMDHLNFVTRLMLPDANGTPVDIINNEYF